MRAWHFLRNDGTLRYDDGRKPANGEKITVDCMPRLCEAGLHASVRVLDALHFAPGSILCEVEIGGTVIVGTDKIVGTERTILRRIDALPVIVKFANWCADRAKEHTADAAHTAAYAAAAAANAAARDAYAAAHAAAYAANAAAYAAAAYAAAARQKEVDLQNTMLSSMVEDAFAAQAGTDLSGR